jgi:hypothetical protein
MGTSGGKILTYKSIDVDPEDVRRVQEIETNFQPRAMREFATDPSVKQLLDREMVLVRGDTRYIAVRVGNTLYKLGMSEAGDFVKIEGDTMTGQLGSSVVIGTAPMNVTSTTVNTNFNADLVDGQHLSVTDTPTFDGVILSSLTANRLVSSDGTKALVSVAALTAWVSGTTNQIIVTDDGDGTITLSTPQDIHTGATPEFVSAKLSGLSASRLLRLGATNVVASVTDLTVWIGGTSNRVTVSDDGDGSVTLTTPQDSHTGASPTFVGLTLSGLTASRLMATDGTKAAVSVAALTSWIAGTVNQITVTDDGDGTVTLSTPQDIHTGATPSFAGFTKIGDASNYTTIEADGTVEFNGDATVWDDLRIPGSSVQKGASAPDLGTFLGSGNLLVNRFDGNATTEQIYFTAQLPHSYKQGSDIYPHIHWTPTDGNAGNVKWQLEYSWQNINGTFSGTTTLTVTDSTDSTAWKHLLAPFSAITGTSKTISSMLVCRLFRDPSDGDDTYGSDAALLEIDFHFEIDTVGSRQALSK